MVMSPEARVAARRESDRRYYSSAKGKARRAIRNATPEAREKARQRSAKHRASAAFDRAKARKADSRYQKTPKGRTVRWRKDQTRRGAKATFAAAEYRDILLGDPCSYCGDYCGDRRVIEADHITAVSAGGVTDWDNLTASCRSCNSRKHARSFLAYLRERLGRW